MGLLERLLDVSISGELRPASEIPPAIPSKAPKFATDEAKPPEPAKRPAFSLVKVRAERMRRSFELFARNAWSQIDPAPLVWGRHMSAICTCLQAVTEKKIEQLLINVPPGYAKSLLCSVLWPAWEWARDPSASHMVASYEVNLAMGFSVKTRELVLTQWYQDHFVKGQKFEEWTFKADQDTKAHYANTAQGYRLSLGVGGKGTGYRAKTLVIDDPLKADDAHSAAALEGAIRWFDETMSTRSNDPAWYPKAMICQRLHEADPSAHVLKQGGWEHLNLMAEFDPLRKSVVKAKDGTIIFEDWRKVKGEVLFPERFPAHVLKSLRRKLGSFAASAQLDQSPSPAAGGVIKRAWLTRRWIYPGQSPIEGFECKELPLAFDTIELHCDAAFKNTETSDFVACGVYGKKGPHVFLLDMIWRRMGFVDTIAALLHLRGKWRKISTVAIEDKANGSAIIELFKQKIPGIVPVEPEGGKLARIHASSKWIEAGNFWLPAASAWGNAEEDQQVGDFVEEAASFPMASHDDAIDVTSQALNRMCTDADLAWLENWVAEINLPTAFQT